MYAARSAQPSGLVGHWIGGELIQNAHGRVQPVFNPATGQHVRDVALVTRGVLNDFGLVGWPKTSGSRGFHIFCRIEPRWTFPEVRTAAVALPRCWIYSCWEGLCSPADGNSLYDT